MIKQLKPEFVVCIPEEKDMVDGELYISTEFGVAIHLCCCGCGNQVVTPFSPSSSQNQDWTLIIDGKTVTLKPSIGNNQFPCKSHYLITRNRVGWVNYKEK